MSSYIASCMQIITTLEFTNYGILRHHGRNFSDFIWIAITWLTFEGSFCQCTDKQLDKQVAKTRQASAN